MYMEIEVWRNLPDEIALNIIARLLPRRSLVRLRTVWKAWNEMLSSYAAMSRIYPNIHLSHTSAFLFQFNEIELSDDRCFLSKYDKIKLGKSHSWVIEGNGDFYKLGEYSYRIEIACNTVFCLHDYSYYYICDEKTRSLKRLYYGDAIESDTRYPRIVKAFDTSTDTFIMLAGGPSNHRVWDSSTGLWWLRQDFEGLYDFKALGRGVHYRGRFYWLDHESCNGGVVEYNFFDSLWKKIPPPHDAIYRDNTFENSMGHEYRTVASVYWGLAGSDVGELILVERECGFLWKLENGEENIDSKRWCRVDICLPREIKLISVNNSGWTVVVGGEGINVYDGSRRLVRKFPLDEIDPRLAMQIKTLKRRTFSDRSLYPPLLPLECTYLWWPDNI